MKSDFDLKKLNKRMPYSVPDNYFADMDEQIWKEISSESVSDVKTKNSRLYILRTSLFAVAAAIILCFLINTFIIKQQSDGFSTIELAFNELTDDNQLYLIQFYQDDIFLNEQKTYNYE